MSALIRAVSYGRDVVIIMSSNGKALLKFRYNSGCGYWAGRLGILPHEHDNDVHKRVSDISGNGKHNNGIITLHEVLILRHLVQICSGSGENAKGCVSVAAKCR